MGNRQSYIREDFARDHAAPKHPLHRVISTAMTLVYLVTLSAPALTFVDLTPAYAASSSSDNADLSCKQVCDSTKDYRDQQRNEQGELTQLDAQCTSMESSNKGKLWDAMILGLNSTALGVCVAECATGALGMLPKMCMALGIAGQAAEIVRAVALKQSNPMSALMGAMGIAMPLLAPKFGPQIKDGAIQKINGASAEPSAKDWIAFLESPIAEHPDPQYKACSLADHSIVAAFKMIDMLGSLAEVFGLSTPAYAASAPKFKAVFSSNVNAYQIVNTETKSVAGYESDLMKANSIAASMNSRTAVPYGGYTDTQRFNDASHLITESQLASVATQVPGGTNPPLEYVRFSVPTGTQLDKWRSEPGTGANAGKVVLTDLTTNRQVVLNTGDKITGDYVTNQLNHGGDENAVLQGLKAPSSAPVANSTNGATTASTGSSGSSQATVAAAPAKIDLSSGNTSILTSAQMPGLGTNQKWAQNSDGKWQLLTTDKTGNVSVSETLSTKEMQARLDKSVAEKASNDDYKASGLSDKEAAAMTASDAKKATDSAAKAKARWQACTAAAFLGITVAQRIMSMRSQQQTSKQSCAMVADLTSNSQYIKTLIKGGVPSASGYQAASGSGGTTTTAKASAAVTGNSSASGASPSSASAVLGSNELANNGSGLPPGYLAFSDQVYVGMDSVQNQGLIAAGSALNLPGGSNVIRAAATASGIDVAAGYDRQLAGIAKRSDLKGLLHAVDSGVPIDNIMSTLVGQAAPALAKPFAELASAMEKDSGLQPPSMIAAPETTPANNNLSLLPNSNPGGSGTSGDAAPSQGGGLLSAVGSFFGAGSNSAPSVINRAPAGVAVGQPTAAMAEPDVHAGTGPSLFQIVSNRLGASADKVQKLDPVIPGNRAMNGLSSITEEKTKH